MGFHQPCDKLPGGGVLLRRQHGEAAYVRPGDGFARKGVVRGQYQGHFLAKERGFQVTGGRFYAFHPGQDCQGNPAVRQQGDDFGPEADCEADLQFRKGLAGFLEHGGELVDPDAVGGAEIQGFPAGLACRGQLLLEPGVAVQAGDGVGVGFLPAVVEHQAAALSVEQAAVQLALQGVDLFGEGGLRAEQLFRGPHLRAFLGQGPQGQQFIHIHCVTPFKL